MIDKNMESALNKQINAELYSEYMYLAMSAYFEEQNFSGMAHWMRVQASEEHEHAMKLYGHIVERGGRVVLDKIDTPPKAWESILATFEAAYEHETKVTAMINSLVELAGAEKDHAAFSMLQWFVDEQVEEEASADKIVQQLKMIKAAPGLILQLDRVLAQRKRD